MVPDFLGASMQTHMTEKVAAQFKKLLLARRMELSRQSTPSREEKREADRDDLTEADSTAVPDTEFPQSAEVRGMLIAMDAALARIAGGTFGECMACGQEIGTKRLVAFPWTRYCLACEHNLQKPH